MLIIKLVFTLFCGTVLCALNYGHIPSFLIGALLGFLFFSHFQFSNLVKNLKHRISELEDRLQIIGKYNREKFEELKQEIQNTKDQGENLDNNTGSSDKPEIAYPEKSSSEKSSPDTSNLEVSIPQQIQNNDINTEENKKPVEAEKVSSQIENVETKSERSTRYESPQKHTHEKPLNCQSENSQQEKIEPIKEDNKSAFDNTIGSAVSFVKNFFTTGNTIVRVGIVILFIGISFLLKYVSDHSNLPVEIRYIAAGAFGFALLAIGWRLRRKNLGYSLSLQGGGIGIMYLTVFAALRISQIITPEIALALMVIIVLLASVIAILQDSAALAILSTLSGLSAPLLASSGSGNFVHLFSYYLILNIGIAIIAWFKSWRVLNLLGFVFTFGIGLTWGIKYYQPEHYNSIQPFLILYFLLYSFISIVFTLKQNSKTAKYIDGTLVFGTPIAAFGLQTAIVHEINMGSGISAAIIGAYYVLITFIIFKKLGHKAKPLLESFIAFAIGFLTIAIPLISANGKITSAAWAIEGAALIWIGIKQKRALARITGVILVLASSIAYIYQVTINIGTSHWSEIPYLNSNFIGAFIVVAAMIFICTYLLKNREITNRFEKRALCYPILVYGYIIWLISGFIEVDIVKSNYEILAASTYYSLTAAALFYCSYRYKSIIAFVLSLITTVINLFIIFGANSIIDTTDMPLLNIEFISAAICSLPTIIASFYCVHRNRSEELFVGYKFSFASLCYGIAILLISAVHDMYLKISFEYWTTLSALLCSITIYLFGTSGTLLRWQQPKIIKLGLIPVLIFFMLIDIFNGINLYEGYGFIIFTILILFSIFVTYKNDQEKIINSSLIQILFVVAVTYIATWQIAQAFNYLLETGDKFFTDSLYGVIPAAIFGFILLNRNSLKWPISNHRNCYSIYIPMILSSLIGLWILYININTPIIGSIPYIPILNLCDIGHIVIIICSWTWYKTVLSDRLILKNEHVYSALFLMLFTLINFILFRTMHVYFEVPFNPKDIYDSNLAQSSISVLWGITGMGIMILSAKKLWRSVWICGAAIIAILVVKLFIIDTSEIGTIARIITFITVGIILLITGYFAPVPPNKEKISMEETSKTESSKIEIGKNEISEEKV